MGYDVKADALLMWRGLSDLLLKCLSSAEVLAVQLLQLLENKQEHRGIFEEILLGKRLSLDYCESSRRLVRNAKL